MADHFGENARLAAALLEAAHVDEAGHDDLTRTHRRDSADGHEHAPLAGNLDDQAHHSGSDLGAVHDEHIAQFADALASRIEHPAPGEAPHENP